MLIFQTYVSHQFLILFVYFMHLYVGTVFTKHSNYFDTVSIWIIHLKLYKILGIFKKKFIGISIAFNTDI